MAIDKDLEIIEERDRENTRLLLTSLAPDADVRPIDFLPESFRKGLRPPFGNSLDPKMPIPVLLPFYETLIVGISPFKNLEAFEANYGLTMNQLLDEAGRGRILLTLNGYPRDYHGLSYLAPLLNRFHPPSIICLREGFEIFASHGELPKLRSRAEAVFQKTIGSVPQATQYLRTTRAPLDKVIRGAIAGMIELQILGAESAVACVESIARDDPVAAAGLINTVFRPLYVDHEYGSFGGEHPVIRSSSLESQMAGRVYDNVFFFDEEIGRSLVENLPTPAPSHYAAFHEIDSGYSMMRKAMAALRHVVRTTDKHRIGSARDALLKAWEEIRKIQVRARDMARVVQTIAGFGAIVPALYENPKLVLFAFASWTAYVHSDSIGRHLARRMSDPRLVIVYDLLEPQYH